MKERACELCNEDAAVYCPSDSAFLCINCDAKVHEANFLVARHIRHAVCFNRNNVTGNIISGAGFHSTATCPQIDDSDSLSSSSNSSACISSTTSPAKEYSSGRNRGSSSSVNRKSQSEVKFFKAEAILVNWCGKLGVREYDVVVRMACSVLRVCLDRGTVLLPFRVFLAASMWLGLRLGAGGKSNNMTWQVLKRLEEVSGVPAKVILAAESKMAHALTLRSGGENQKKQLHRRRLELEEGWAEC
ncbi:hypothetical protein ACJIZ3_021046 [Penstemon smallii]|uniref:B box-type domain-containing protein n=1 Tax=Penstemon smallii TaxID=265156 RepID=A0ABD3SKC0_9LAMI